MKTKILIMIIFAMIFANAVNAQWDGNPKIKSTVPAFQGSILVAGYDDIIKITDKTLDDFSKMQTSIATHDTQIAKQQGTNDKQQETIRNQQEEIADLKAENKEIKTDISQLERTINDLKRQLDEVERAIKK